MNLPNKLTILRALMVPVYVFFMLFPAENELLFRWIACAVFCIASFTDFLDGYIARKRNLVTNFGKFMDPLADKLLVCAAMICMIPLSYLPAWYVIMLILQIPALNLVTTVFVYLSLALTIISLIDYLYKNRSVLEEGGF